LDVALLGEVFWVEGVTGACSEPYSAGAFSFAAAVELTREETISSTCSGSDSEGLAGSEDLRVRLENFLADFVEGLVEDFVEAGVGVATDFEGAEEGPERRALSLQASGK